MSCARHLAVAALAGVLALPGVTFARDVGLHGYLDGRLVRAPAERSWIDGRPTRAESACMPGITRFWHLGASADTGPVTWIAQAMDGDTTIEPIAPRVLTTHYRAAFARPGFGTLARIRQPRRFVILAGSPPASMRTPTPRPYVS
jgi:hypothetical protein